MKDSNNTSLTIRTKVSSNLNNSISSLTPSVQTSKLNNSNNNSINKTNQHNNSNDLDDEEVDINRLIIDLDADIEKSNDRLSSENESHFQPTTLTTTSISKSPTNLLGFFETNSTKIMSNTTNNKIKEINNTANQITSSNVSNAPNLSSTINNKTITNLPSNNSATNLQTSTGDKGLKMKIQKVKSVSGKSSDTKLEIVQSVQSDTISTSRHNNSNFKIDKNGFNKLANSNSLNNSSSTNDVEKIKHSSSKSKNSSHKEKKAKRDKEKEKNNNNNLNKNSNEFQSSSSSNSNDKIILNFDKKILNNEHSFNNQLKKDADFSLEAPPSKKIKNDEAKNTQNSNQLIDNVNKNDKPKPEMRSVSTSTNVSTMTEPECLGYCEPGSTICLEGITWVEAEGVLVVNVTWRGKSYVGTLLDCTRHDWGPPHPRLCDSPTSDLESKGFKSGRGKRARTSISEQEPRLFQSKLRNGKGRRNFQIPASPIKMDQNKRNNRNNINGNNSKDNNTDNKITVNNSQSNNNSCETPKQTPADNLSTSDSPVSKQPKSPVLIECPQPNCSKKYKHINGLKYHESHCLYTAKGDSNDNCKESNINDTEEMETENTSNLNSPTSQLNIENNNSNDNNDINDQSTKQSDNNENNKTDQIKNNANSPSSNILDAEETLNESELNKNNLIDKIKLENNFPTAISKDLNSKEINLQNKDNESKLNIKEENKLNDNNDQINKPSIINGVDKNGLNSVNQQQQQQHQSTIAHSTNTINPNFSFPYMVPPNPHFPMQMDQFQALLMQDRLMLDEQQKQQQQAFQTNFNHEIKNQQPIHHKTPTSISSPHGSNRFSPQTQQTLASSSIFNQTNNNSTQLNKPESSPYDFNPHNEIKREEGFKLSSNKNSLGNLSSPKQQQTPGSVNTQHLLNQQSTPNSNIKEEQRLTPKQHNIKQEENIKPPGMELLKPIESIGGPAPPNHSFYHSMSPFLGQSGIFGPPPGFSPQFDPQLLRATGPNPFQQNFMNNLGFPSGPQMQIPPNLANAQQQQDLLNSKLISGLNKKSQFEMLHQSPNSASKNGLPRQSNQLGQNQLDNISPRLGQNHPNMPDPYQALMNISSNKANFK